MTRRCAARKIRQEIVRLIENCICRLETNTGVRNETSKDKKLCMQNLLVVDRHLY